MLEHTLQWLPHALMRCNVSSVSTHLVWQLFRRNEITCQLSVLALAASAPADVMTWWKDVAIQFIFHRHASFRVRVTVSFAGKLCKGQIPLGPVPRNFLVANVTRKSPTSYRLVTRKLATFRSSRHVKMVWRVANFLVTSRPYRTCGIWRTTRQADKPAADRRSTNHVSSWKLRHCLRKRMAASGTCLQVLTASNLIFTPFTTSQYFGIAIWRQQKRKEN